MTIQIVNCDLCGQIISDSSKPAYTAHHRYLMISEHVSSGETPIRRATDVCPQCRDQLIDAWNNLKITKP